MKDLNGYEIVLKDLTNEERQRLKKYLYKMNLHIREIEVVESRRNANYIHIGLRHDNEITWASRPLSEFFYTLSGKEKERFKNYKTINAKKLLKSSKISKL